MLIIELFEDSPDPAQLSKMAAIISQIAARTEDTGSKSATSLKSIVGKLNDAGINVTGDDLKELINDEPLSNYIVNIAGDNVTFRGQSSESDDAMKPSKTTGTLEKMAKRASKKRD